MKKRVLPALGLVVLAAIGFIFIDANNSDDFLCCVKDCKEIFQPSGATPEPTDDPWGPMTECIRGCGRGI